MAGSDSKIEKYRQLLVNLLPKGRLWQPQAQPIFNALLKSWAVEFCRVDDAWQRTLKDVDPRTTDDLLEDWERILALPDECSPENQTEAERIQQVVQKFTNVGGLSKEFFEFLTAQLGFPSEVDSRVEFQVGGVNTARGAAGDPISNYFLEVMEAGDTIGQALRTPGWRAYFNVEIPADAVQTLDAGDVIGQPLRVFTNELIQCTVRKLKPAHSAVTFTFKEED